MVDQPSGNGEGAPVAGQTNSTVGPGCDLPVTHRRRQRQLWDDGTYQDVDAMLVRCRAGRRADLAVPQETPVAPQSCSPTRTGSNARPRSVNR
jgi:hypothetical protein